MKIEKSDFYVNYGSHGFVKFTKFNAARVAKFAAAIVVHSYSFTTSVAAFNFI